MYVFITFNEILKWKYVYVYEAGGALPESGKPTRFGFWWCFLCRCFHLIQLHGTVSDDWKNVYHFEEKRLLVA